ncbi:MAG: thiamine diphosphokinase [Spirochaetales bacterium]|uniref:Thiamine diphosphokinase n=1 Tax=Candidatus Thalassospirochaeta sargassi TaxID=3119039 RepID=A0AAJ1MLM8_9SPIO|nr:thiamine diphosphokinase [Spirochaetales bacterium]
MKNGKAVIFTGGAGPTYEKVSDLIESAEIIVAADSGWDLATSLGVSVDYCIGDMDSVVDKEGMEKLPPERRKIFPVEKDFSDTELSIIFLEEKNYRDIVLIGGGGGRIDHTLALKALFAGRHKPAMWFTADESILYLEGNRDFPCAIGRTVSIFSCDESGAYVTTKGLKWELNNFEMNSTSFSLSNKAVSESVTITVHSGAVLVMFNYQSS